MDRDSVSGRTVDRVMRFPMNDDGSARVTDFQVAVDLMPETTVVDLDTGPWPLSPRRTAAVALLLLLVAAGTVLLLRRASR
jgi:hypothetical protein